ncbi:hypothetical protein PRNP1_008083 [Phytophthora ramorum]
MILNQSSSLPPLPATPCYLVCSMFQGHKNHMCTVIMYRALDIGGKELAEFLVPVKHQLVDYGSHPGL